MKHLNKILLSLFLIIAYVVPVSINAQVLINNRVPGTISGLVKNRHAAALAATVGLQQFYSSTGHYTISADGIGSGSSSMKIRVNKPTATATVEKAVLISSLTPYSSITNGCVSIGGVPINWDGSASVSFFTNYWADVTTIVAAQVSSFPAGISTLNITECNTGAIDGEALLVVFNDPSATEKTVIIMLGAENPAGDNFSVTLAKPIDPSQAGALLDMGLGIGFSYQGDGTQQFSQVSVNNQRLTTAAGGDDDGEAANGALITVGGIGDLNTNPANPLATPTNDRSDDELYSILPFINNSTTSLNINTINPSLDDNIFLAYFALSGAAIIGEGILLSQTSTSGNVGTSHTVKAAVLNTTGQPVPGRLVTFTITSGPNAGGTFATNTDANGEAFYTYTGSGGQGTDNIQACFTNSQSQKSCSNTLSFQWLPSVVLHPNYYSKPTGDLHNVATWGHNPDGSGDNPPGFNGGSDYEFYLANRPGIYTMTGDWSLSSKLHIPMGSELQINNFTLTINRLGETGGTLSGSLTSNLVTTGTELYTLNFTPGKNNLNNLTSAVQNLATMFLTSPLNVFGVFTLSTPSNGNGKFDVGNYLTLKSTATSTARVAPVSPNAAILGNITVERYIPARRAWRLLSAPIADLTTPATATVSSSILNNAQANLATAPVTSTGAPRPASFGNASFSLNAAHTALTFTATVYNVDFTGTQTPADANDNLVAAHIHAGPLVSPTTNGPVVWGFFGSPLNDNSPNDVVFTPFTTGVGGTISGKWDLPEGNNTTLTAQLPNLLSGHAYINFHTVQFPGGEVHGAVSLVEPTPTINQSWQERTTTFSPNPNPNPGFGTHVTQSASNGADGLDFNIETAMSSLKMHNNVNNTWVPVLNTNTTPVNSRAWFIFVRGDRSINMGFNTVAPNNTTLRATGPLRIGDQAFPIAATGLTSIPNPYASPVSFTNVFAHNSRIKNSFTVVDPKLGSTGAFVNVSYNGTGYDVTPAAASPINELIQSGQGFLVESLGATQLTLSESDKSATAARDVFRTNSTATTSTGLRINLQSVSADGVQLLDEVYSSYSDKYSNSIDNFDALKAANPEENLAIITEDKELMVDRRKPVDATDVIRLKLWNTTEQSYTLEFNPVNLNSSNVFAYLKDNFLNSRVAIDLNGVTKVPFMVTSDAASKNPYRFEIGFSKTPIEALVMGGKGEIQVAPNPTVGRTLGLQLNNQDKGIYTVELVDNSGRIVYKSQVVHTGGSGKYALTLNSGTAKGVYKLRVTQGKAVKTIQVLIN